MKIKYVSLHLNHSDIDLITQVIGMSIHEVSFVLKFLDQRFILFSGESRGIGGAIFFFLIHIPRYSVTVLKT